MCQFSMGLSDRFLTNRVARSVSFILIGSFGFINCVVNVSWKLTSFLYK